MLDSIKFYILRAFSIYLFCTQIIFLHIAMQGKAEIGSA